MLLNQNQIKIASYNLVSWLRSSNNLPSNSEVFFFLEDLR